MTLAGHASYSAGVEHHFALCFQERLARELRSAGASVHHLPEARVSNVFSVLRARRRLRELLQAFRFDLAIVHSAWSHVLFAVEIRRAGLPEIFWLHTRAAGDSALERMASMRFPGGVISVSRWVDESAANLFPSVPSFVVYTPFASEMAYASSRSDIRQENGAKEYDVIILQASRMESWKGHRELLEALALLRDEPRWVCWIAGDVERAEEQSYFDGLRQLVRELSIEGRVRFLGQRDDVSALMRGADIYCQPNREAEGFSIVFLEACLAELPIVTSAIGGALEIVNDQCGALVAPRRADLVANALRRLIANPALRRRMGMNGRQRALERCEAGRQFGALERVFRQVIEQHG